MLLYHDYYVPSRGLKLRMMSLLILLIRLNLFFLRKPLSNELFFERSPGFSF